MASILDIKAMGSILHRRSRGRIWNNDISVVDKKDNKKVKKKGHFNKHWDQDLWD